MLSRILIYGESWQGCHGKLLLDELFIRGYDAKIFDHTNYLPGIINRDLFERIKRNLFLSIYSARIQKAFLKEIDTFNPSHIFVCKGLHLNRKTLNKIKKRKIFIINWNPDDFLNMKNSNNELIKSISKYDLIISSRPHLFNEYKLLGANNLLFIDWYFVPTLHKKRGLPIIHNITFVGSWSKKREKFIQSIPLSVRIWGGGWEKSSNDFKANNEIMFKILNQEEMSKVFEQSRFNLNLLTDENRDLSNLRFFEVPASGGLLLTERNKIAEKYLKEGEECIMFDSVKDLLIKLKSQQDLNTISHKGTKKILETNNAFADRVDEIINFLNKAC